jgi:hypothetical protein
MAEIVVTRTLHDPDDAERTAARFRVQVREGDTSTEHDVTLSAGELERLAGDREPEDFVRDCFAFLLEREPKESILHSFDVSTIGRYFPEFEREIAQR